MLCILHILGQFIAEASVIWRFKLKISSPLNEQCYHPADRFLIDNSSPGQPDSVHLFYVYLQNFSLANHFAPKCRKTSPSSLSTSQTSNFYWDCPRLPSGNTQPCTDRWALSVWQFSWISWYWRMPTGRRRPHVTGTARLAYRQEHDGDWFTSSHRLRF